MNSFNNRGFQGKKIIVTGASKGLGASISKVLASKGAKLALLARSKQKMDNLKKNFYNSKDHISIKLDLSKNNQIKPAINKAKNFLKNIDIVIHVAGGGFGFKNPLLSNNELQTLFQVNLGAAAEINRIIISSKDKNSELKLIHVGSIASVEAVGSVGYNIAKSAFLAYVKSLGREYYKYNIIVTGILPGGFIAKGNSMERFKKKNLKDYKKFIKTRLPRRKMGHVDEIIPVILFLCSNYSSMMGGSLVPIDGGESKSYFY